MELRTILDGGYNLNLQDYPIFDENYRESLNKKILQHFKFREIGFETPALFKHYLNQTMAEIMPYYNQLYESQLLVFNPLYTKNLEETSNRNTNQTAVEEEAATQGHTKTFTSEESQTRNTDTAQTSDVSNIKVFDGSDTLASEQEGTTTQDNVITVDSLQKQSDTPQDVVSDLNNYLSGAVKDDGSTTEDRAGTETIGINETRGKDETTTDTGTLEASTEVNENVSRETNQTDTLSATSGKDKTTTINNLNSYTRHVFGYEKSPVDLLTKFRSSFLNIDMQVIRELNNLFMGVY